MSGSEHPTGAPGRLLPAPPQTLQGTVAGLAALLLELLWGLLWTTPGIAAEFELFLPGGAPSSRYEEILSKVNPGDRLRFGNGQVFQLGRRLDRRSEGVTAVFELASQPDRVLRVSRLPDPMERWYLASMAKGSELLEREQIPAVRLLDRSRPTEYLVAEKIPGRLMSAEAMLLDGRLTSQARSTMEASLLSFARRSAPFQEIGDFTLNQLAYDTKRGTWLLIDWTDGHKTALQSRPGQATAFSPDTIWNDAFEHLLADGRAEEGRGRPLTPEQRTRIKSLYDRIDDTVWEERQRLTSQSAPMASGSCPTVFRGLSR